MRYREILIAGVALAAATTAFAERIELWIPPQSTDPAIDQWLEPHFVCIDPAVPARGALLCFFPGSNAVPAQYEYLTRTAADAGYHAIALRYPNSWSVNFDLCGLSSDPNCHDLVRYEILNGVDTSPLPEIDISPTNCIRNRLAKLLSYLLSTRPGEGWEQYLDGGQADWSRIAVAGHSQGGGHSAYIAKHEDVWRVIMFAGGTDQFFGQPDPFADWLAEHVTPSIDYWGLAHLQDTPSAYLGAWEILGLNAFGPPVLVDFAAPPYARTHRLVTQVVPPTLPAPAAYHNSVAVDDDTPLDADGVPRLLPAWRYLFDVCVPPGNLDLDADVDLRDVARLQAAFGRCRGDAGFFAASDADFNGCVDLVDARAQLLAMGSPSD